MKLGISSYTYTWAVGVPGSLPDKPIRVMDLLQKAISLQVGCLQIADNLSLQVVAKSELEELYKHSLTAGIVLETGTRGLTPENLQSYTDIASFLQSPILRIVVDNNNYHPDVEEIVAIIKDFVPELKKKELKLAIENHDRFPAKTFAGIVEKIGSEQVGICLDSVNSMGAGEGIETVVDILGPLTINLHIKDFMVRRVSHMMGFVVEGTPAGKGLLALEVILEKLSHHNRCQSAVLELWTPPEKNVAETIEKEDHWARESISYLKQLDFFDHAL